MRVLNKKYWPKSVTIYVNDETYADSVKWCRNMFGNSNFRIIDDSTFFFRSEEDATMFKLRWS